jgi:hypothetical protein
MTHNARPSGPVLNLPKPGFAFFSGSPQADPRVAHQEAVNNDQPVCTCLKTGRYVVGASGFTDLLVPNWKEGVGRRPLRVVSVIYPKAAVRFRSVRPPMSDLVAVRHNF